MPSPKVSIIIINYNGKKLLEKCLESLFKVDYEHFEVILVDNNSVDDSINFVETNHPNVQIIKLDKNYGFAEPNNIAAKQAKGDLLFFLNNDTSICKNSISELVKNIQGSDYSICQSLLLNLDGGVDSSGDFMITNGISYNSKEKYNYSLSISSKRYIPLNN